MFYDVLMGNYALVLAENVNDRAAYHWIRREVLFEARGRIDYIVDGPDELKPENMPLLLKYDGDPVGTVRLDQRPDGTAIVRLVAIVARLQRHGHGKVLMDLVEGLAAACGTARLYVHAAPDAVGFYQRLGFTPHRFEDGAFDSVQLHKRIGS